MLKATPAFMCIPELGCTDVKLIPSITILGIKLQIRL